MFFHKKKTPKGAFLRLDIEACKNKDKETTAHLVEENWLSLEKLMTYETD